MPRSTEVRIDGTSYIIEELLTVERDELLFESADIMGDAFTLLIENYFAETEGLKELSVSAVLRGIIRDGNGTPRQKAEFIKKLVQSSVKSPANICKDDGYKLHFTAQYEHRAELIWEIYKLNFGPAIEELKKKLQNSGIFTQKSSEDQAEPSEKALNSESEAKSSLKVNFLNG